MVNRLRLSWISDATARSRQVQQLDYDLGLSFFQVGCATRYTSHPAQTLNS